ncbi:MAG: hypothetical protein K6T91_07870 [Firmicutes bacterium]|nr:hypothetical protein [Bacillota bacterium]
MPYGKLLKNSLKTVWSNKVIWLFGMLLVFFSGSGFNFANYNIIPLGGPEEPAAMSPNELAAQVAYFIDRYHLIPYIIAGIALLVVYLIAGIFLRPLFNGTLIGLVSNAYQGRSAGFKDGLTTGRQNMYKILGQSILVSLPLSIVALVVILIIALLVVLPLVQGSDPPGERVALSVVIFLISLPVLLVIGVLVDFIGTLAARFIVIEGKGIVDSIKTAALTFRQNLGQVFLAGLIAFGVGIAADLLIAVLFLAAGIPLVLIGTHNLVLALVMAVPLMFGMLALIGFVKAFISAYWTYFFITLRSK